MRPENQKTMTENITKALHDAMFLEKDLREILKDADKNGASALAVLALQLITKTAEITNVLKQLEQV